MTWRSPAYRDRVTQLVTEQLGEAIICAQCGATLATYEYCSAELDERCLGFEVVDAARRRAELQLTLTFTAAFATVE